jgi:integrase
LNFMGYDTSYDTKGTQKLVSRPKKPYPNFPLFPNLNGQWCCKVKGKPYYFGKWADDLKGERALADWTARQVGIHNGTDGLRAAPAVKGMILSDLAGRFLTAKRTAMLADDLSKRSFGDYVQTIRQFVDATGEQAEVNALGPQHFQAFADALVKRKLGRHARKRIIACIKAMLNYGADNGYFPRPTYGTGFKTLDCSPEAIRQEKRRAGVRDYSGRIITGTELDALVGGASPLFKAIVLLSVNCGLGPADIGRIQWNNIDMSTGELDMARPKTGAARRSYVWKRTRKALERVAKLKHNKAAIKRHGDEAMIFIGRRGLPLYREKEIVKAGQSHGVKVANSISSTFNKLARSLKLKGVSHYRLRHTFKTLGKKAGDRDALNLAMGHLEPGIGRVYDHETIPLARLKRVALAVKSALWPKPAPAKKKQAVPAKTLKPGQLRLAS